MMKKKIVIEVGSCDGSDSYNYYNQGYRVFTFEPHQPFFNTIKNHTAEWPDFTILNKAVSLKNGITDFNVCQSGGASSILPFKDNSEIIKHWGEDRGDVLYSGYTYSVETIRLDTFIEEYELQNEKIDFLHIDAQGVDLDVLKSLGKYVANVNAGVIETATSTEKTIYKGQTNVLSEAISWLEQNGFQINEVRPNDRTNCEVNIYFSKKKSIV